MRNNIDGMMEKLPIKPLIMHSIFYKQYCNAVAKGEITDPNPLNFFTNMMSLVVFPFIAKPLLQKIGEVADKQFEKMIQERKKLIPVWIKAMMKVQ